MTPTAHTSFVIERRFKASAARVFAAWADPATKQRWNDCHAETGATEFSMTSALAASRSTAASSPTARRWPWTRSSSTS